MQKARGVDRHTKADKDMFQKIVEFSIRRMGKETFKATVVAIDQSVDATDYSIKVYARVLSNCPDFRPGMYVRARIKN